LIHNEGSILLNSTTVNEFLLQDPSGRALFSYCLNALIDPATVYPFNSESKNDLKILFQAIQSCPKATLGDFSAESGKGLSYNFMDGGYKSADTVEPNIQNQCDIEFKKYVEIKKIALNYGRGLINFNGPGGAGEIYSPLWLSKDDLFLTGRFEQFCESIKEGDITLYLHEALALLDATVAVSPEHEGVFLWDVAANLRQHSHSASLNTRGTQRTSLSAYQGMSGPANENKHDDEIDIDELVNQKNNLR
jgi:hypothetical protein